jgi:hypothetical protein
MQLPEKLINNDYTNTELGKRGKHRWNGRSFIKWLEDSNLKYKRLSVRKLNQREKYLFCFCFSVNLMNVNVLKLIHFIQCNVWFG